MRHPTSPLRIATHDPILGSMRTAIAALLLALALAPAVNAEEIVWIHNHNGVQCHPECGFDLWTMGPADGSGARIYASSSRGNAQGAAWSPDGRFVAYTSSKEGPTGNGGFGGVSDLHVAKSDLSEDRVIAQGLVGLRSDPSWSPDGRTLVFRLMSYPDGERPFLEGDLWTIAADGSGLRQLTALPGDENLPAFVPGGGRVSFLYGRRSLEDGAREPSEVFSVAADGSDLTRMTLGNVSAIQNGLSYSPDGREVAFVGNDGATLVMSVAGGDVRRVPFIPSLDPAWSPRGDSLVFAGSRAFDLFRVDLLPAPGRPVRLTRRDPRAPSYGSSHAWLGDLASPPRAERTAPAVVLARARRSKDDGSTSWRFGPATGTRSGRVLTVDRPSQLRFLVVDRSGLRRVSVAVQRRSRARSSAPRRFRRLTSVRVWRRLVRSWRPGTYELRFRTVDVRGNAARGSRRLLVRVRGR